jgi:hypothetical protein
MQGGPRRNLAKSHQISIAWNGVSLLKRAGKSRENHLCPAGWRSRLRPDTGDCPLEPVLASNLQHLHFSECQLEPWETRWDSELGTLTPQLKLLGLDRCRQSRCGNRSEAKRRALAPCRHKIAENAGWDCELLAIELPDLAESPGARRPRHSDHRDGKALCSRRRKRWLITVWLEVRVLPGPPRSPMRTDVSRSLTNSPQFAGISTGSNAGRPVSAPGWGRDSVDFGCRSLGSANPFLAPAGVAREEPR